MRAQRGLLAAIGASTSLIAAAAFALLAVSTVVAFKGWPLPRTPQPALETSKLIAAHDPGQRGRTSPLDGAELALPAVAARRRAESRRTGAETRRAAPRASSPGGPVAVSPGPGPGGSPVTATQAPVDPPAPRPPVTGDPPARPGDPAREVGDGLGQTTEEVTDSVGEVIAPASPELSEGVQQVGGGLGQTLTDVGESVGGLVDGLLGGGR